MEDLNEFEASAKNERPDLLSKQTLVASAEPVSPFLLPGTGPDAGWKGEQQSPGSLEAWQTCLHRTRTGTSLVLTVPHVPRTWAEPTGSGWDTHSWGAWENKDGTHTTGGALLSPLVGSMPTGTQKSLQWPFLVF